MKQAKRSTGMYAAGTFSRCRSPRARAAALGMGFGAPAIGQAPKTLRFGHMLPDDARSISKAIAMFARRDGQAVGQQDQGGDLPELAARHDLGDAAVGAGRVAVDVDGGARVVFELHEAARRVHAAVPGRQSADKLRAALDGAIGARDREVWATAPASR